MQLQLSRQRYQLDIPQAVWSEFFAQFTDDNQGRLVTLKLRDAQLGDVDVLRHQPLNAMAYPRPEGGHDLVVTVGQPHGAGQATFAHRVESPQSVSIITDEDGLVLSCTVTHDDQSQTVISLGAALER
jgi:hypothetical protein